MVYGPLLDRHEWQQEIREQMMQGSDTVELYRMRSRRRGRCDPVRIAIGIAVLCIVAAIWVAFAAPAEAFGAPGGYGHTGSSAVVAIMIASRSINGRD